MILRQKHWQLQEAKNRLSEVVRRACTEGPQVITLRGEEVAVVLDIETYRRSRIETSQAESILRAMEEWADENEDIELELPPRTIDESLPPRLYNDK